MYTTATTTPQINSSSKNISGLESVVKSFRPIEELTPLVEQCLKKSEYNHNRDNLPKIDVLVDEEKIHEFDPKKVFAYAVGKNPASNLKFAVTCCNAKAAHKEPLYGANGVMYLESEVTDLITSDYEHLTHTICKDCAPILYPKYYGKGKN